MTREGAFLNRLLERIEKLAAETLLGSAATALSLETFRPKDTEDLVVAAALALREYVAHIRTLQIEGATAKAVTTALEIGSVYANLLAWKAEPDTELGRKRREQVEAFGRARWTESRQAREHRDRVFVDLNEKLKPYPEYPSERARAEYIAARWSNEHPPGITPATVRGVLRRARKASG